MADTHGLFWNSNNGDRVYDADSFAEWLAPFFDNGVLTDSFAPSAGSGMTVTVSSGTGLINGRLRTVDESTTLTVETASPTYSRIDNIVLESNISNREITLKVVKGSYSTSPSAPDPVRTNDAYQLVIAQVRVEAGATSISTSSISDCRSDASLCGYVSAVLGEELKSEIDAAVETAKEAKATVDNYRAIVETKTMTGLGYNFVYQALKDGYELVSAKTVRSDSQYAVTGIQYNATNKVYTILLSQSVTKGNNFQLHMTWVKV